MSTLLVWKDQIEKIYARYSFYIVKILQFVLGLCVFGLINSNIGFMKALSSTVCTVGLAAVTAFLPVGMLALVAALLVLVHLYALSLPVAGLCLAIFLVMYIFYVRFTPKKSWLVVVAAVAVALKVPYVIPVVFGLLGAPSFAVSMMLGTIVYYMLHTVKLTASAFQSGGVKELLDGIMVFTKQILANKEMWMMVVVLLLAMMVVYGVRTRGISHAWKTASVAGAIVAAVLQVSGCMTLDVSFQASFILLDLVVAVAAGLIAEFFFLSVDYSRTETLQFEDDEYYYYVKAVPKVGVTLPMVFTKQILANKEMWMMVVVLLLAMMVVYGVRTRGISHAWKTASVAGAIVAAVLQVSGCMTLDVSFQASFILLDLVVAVAAGLIAEFFFLSVDYSRTETLQFEDDEYYYYVKAVPKVGVTLPEKQVKHITEPHEEQPKEVKAAVNLKPEPMVQETVAIDTSQIQEADLEKNVDELLLTQSLNEELRQNQNEPEDDLSLTKSLGDLWTKKPGSGE